MWYELLVGNIVNSVVSKDASFLVYKISSLKGSTNALKVMWKFSTI